MGLYSSGDEARYISENSKEEVWRDQFRRDYARVIHCPSFRRLQGKTQLFPGHESDFFRNRLTHSLEVGQIAESIAHRINANHPYFKDNNINPRICLTAALLHDIGHPPFGHNGEAALDRAMRKFGGFEGNAQTLRIVSQLEKKRYKQDVKCLIDRRSGLNLTYRTLAAVLKYDNQIPKSRNETDSICKGYYAEDEPVVRDIKKHVASEWCSEFGHFKTIECAIMDIADDIAYSTYDLEDCLKAGFLTPSDILSSDPTLLEKVAKKVGKETEDDDFSIYDVLNIFLDMFKCYVEPPEIIDYESSPESDLIIKILDSVEINQQLSTLNNDGYVRTNFTASLVGRFVNSINVDFNEKFPQMSSIIIDKNIHQEIEALKNYTFESTIDSSRVKVPEYRGYSIVSEIFKSLSEQRGIFLLPADYVKLYKSAKDDMQKRNRVICDFIAGMTDKYAIEFYGRLHSDSPQSIFKPL